MERAAVYPNVLGETLAESARHAFDLGVQRASGAAIVVALLAALVSWRTLPRTRAATHEEHALAA
ncbi:MAG: MFS transporter, partial [Actinomycetales bacterium]